MNTGVFRPYPSQQPKRYDSIVFAPTANPYLIGPLWDLRAALRREDPKPQTPMRAGVAVFAAPPVASFPAAPVLFTRREASAPPQLFGEPQAAFLTQPSAPYLLGASWDLRAALRRDDPEPQRPPAGPAVFAASTPFYLMPPEWDLRAAYRREDSRPQVQIGAAAVLDDSIIMVGPDPIQPLGAFARESRGLPLPAPEIAVFVTPAQAAYVPMGEVLQLAPVSATPITLRAPALIVSGTPQNVPPASASSAAYFRAPFPITIFSVPAIQLPALEIVPSATVRSVPRSESARIVLSALRMPTGAPSDAPISVPPVLGAYARLAFKWPELLPQYAAILDAIPPAVTRVRIRFGAMPESRRFRAH